MNHSTLSYLLAFFALSTVAFAGQHPDASAQVYNAEDYSAVAAPVEHAPIQAVQQPSVSCSDSPTLAAPQNNAAATAQEDTALAVTVRTESATASTPADATVTSVASENPDAMVTVSSSSSSTVSASPSEVTAAPSEAATVTTSSSDQAAFVGTTTEISATRTISVAEASALAQAQAASPNVLPDDPNTQDVLAQAQAWADEVIAQMPSSPNTDSGSAPSPAEPAPQSGDGTLAGCAETVVPVSGDTCDGIESRLGVEKGTLIRLSAGRINSECLNMLAGETYCVRSA